MPDNSGAKELLISTSTLSNRLSISIRSLESFADSSFSAVTVEF